MIKTIYVISVDDERYISETIKEMFDCGGEITGIELRPSLSYSILESKRFWKLINSKMPGDEIQIS